MSATLGGGRAETRDLLRAMRRAVATRKTQHHRRAQQLSVESLERRLLESRADELADLAEMIGGLEEYLSATEGAHTDTAAETARAEKPEPSITVPQLATAIGQSDGATRNLLDKGLIPGARRKTPGKSNSPWLIPASAPGKYLSTFNRNEH